MMFCTSMDVWSKNRGLEMVGRKETINPTSANDDIVLPFSPLEATQNIKDLQQLFFCYLSLSTERHPQQTSQARTVPRPPHFIPYSKMGRKKSFTLLPYNVIHEWTVPTYFTVNYRYENNNTQMIGI